MIPLLAGLALAQVPNVPEVNTQLFRPSVDARATLWTDDAGRIADGWAGQVRAYGHYANRIFVYRAPDDTVTPVLTDVFELDLAGAAQFDRLRLGVHVPIYLRSTTQVGQDSTGLGDLAFDLRGTILDSSDAPVGLALFGKLSVPTATVDLGLGAGGVGGELGGIVDTQIGKTTLAGNLGARFAPRANLGSVVLDDQFFTRLGLGYAFNDTTGGSIELAGHANFSSAVNNIASVPLEALAGGHKRFDRTVFRLGVGAGLTRGVGTPTFRVLIGVGHERAREEERAPKPRMEVAEERLEVKGKVYFASGRDELLPESHETLDGVAETLKARPDIKLVRIEGHTDNQGESASNQDLSERRAAAVRRYLIDQGVEAERLTSVGKGENEPISDVLAENRRVEFVVVKQKK